MLNPSYPSTWPSTLLGSLSHAQFYLPRSSKLHAHLFLHCSWVTWEGMGCESAPLKLSYVREALKILLKRKFQFRWGPRHCISEKFSGKPHTVVWSPLFEQQGWGSVASVGEEKVFLHPFSIPGWVWRSSWLKTNQQEESIYVNFMWHGSLHEEEKMRRKLDLSTFMLFDDQGHCVEVWEVKVQEVSFGNLPKFFFGVTLFLERRMLFPSRYRKGPCHMRVLWLFQGRRVKGKSEPSSCIWFPQTPSASCFQCFKAP